MGQVHNQSLFPGSVVLGSHLEPMDVSQWEHVTFLSLIVVWDGIRIIGWNVPHQGYMWTQIRALESSSSRLYVDPNKNLGKFLINVICGPK